MNDLAEYNSRCAWHDESDFIAADMKSYGFFKAVNAFSRRRAVSAAYAVRGISDLCSGKGALDKLEKNANREKAARNCVDAALRLVKFHLDGYKYSYDL